ncbi:MAG: pyridoxamine 5'-phosphate oxidase family protein [Kofleriaceae bacterium]
MSLDDVLRFLREHEHVVEASVHGDGGPQAAVIGVAAAIVDGGLELVFDTSNRSRKHANLVRDGRIAIVAWHDATTVQIEARADQPSGDELARVKATYLAAFPDGAEREAWPDIAYWRLRATWIRTSDFSTTPPTITEVALP